MNESLDNLFTVKHVDWIKNATIYEVYIRQYSESGTINAFVEHLPRLKDLGVDILWIMPIQPIGKKNRKGSMGSPYAISDYVTVNPESGSLDDFKNMVTKAHELGMYVILDWVANHTAWDHTWITEHPEFYVHDNEGNIIHPANTDWIDVADLNFSEPALREAMIDSLKYWVAETDIDGYRCDMAMLVPTDFWEAARAELDKIKPVFMLAEAEQTDLLYKAFDAHYNWFVHHMLNDIAWRNRNVWHLDEFFNHDGNNYNENALRMYFTSNHDENKNAGSAIERMGNSFRAFSLLTYVLPGIPMIFSGQETGLNRKLNFFDKDVIDWSVGSEYADFYKQLNSLRKNNKALWSGSEGGPMRRIDTYKNDRVFAVARKKDDNEILAVLNLSPDYQEFHLEDVDYFNDTEDFFTKEKLNTRHVGLQPWGFRFYIR